MAALFFEDFRVGDVTEVGSYTFTKEEIVHFAERFDPQPFHVDEEAAKRSPFGGLIASGWHTSAVAHRMIVDRFLGSDSGSLGSPGADEIRWHKPVRPGDTVHMKVSVLEVTPSSKKPDRGSIRLRYEISNQHGEVVMTMVGVGIFARRPVSNAS